MSSKGCLRGVYYGFPYQIEGAFVFSLWFELLKIVMRCTWSKSALNYNVTDDET